MKAVILSIGSELLAGRIVDSNAAYLSRELQKLAIQVLRHVAVGDVKRHILEALRESARDADLTLVTGGLGPTKDDLTRECVAEFCDVPLEANAQAEADLRTRFEQFGRTPSPSNFTQTRIPSGATLLRNLNGTAPGFAVTCHKTAVFCLPGVPHEMRKMFEDNVLPELTVRRPGAAVVKCFQVFGLGESTIGERIRDLMGEDGNPEVATQASRGVVSVRVTATAASPAQAGRLLQPVADMIRERLGDTVFDDEGRSLPEVVSALCREKRIRLGIAESCTGGEISARLTDLPGASDFLIEAIVAYSNAAKIHRLGVDESIIEQHGAVSGDVAAAMAEGLRAGSRLDLALSVTGIAGPAGGTPQKPVGLVCFGLADSTGTITEQAVLPGDRENVRRRATLYALNFIRRHLLEGTRGDAKAN